MKKNNHSVKCLVCQKQFLSSSKYIRTCPSCKTAYKYFEERIRKPLSSYHVTDSKRAEKILSMPNEYAKQEQEMSADEFEEFLWSEIFKLL